MNPTDLMAFQLVLRNGALAQVNMAIHGLAGKGSDTPEEALAAVIAMMRARDQLEVWKLSPVIHKLIGKTRSEKLYRVAEELGCLELSRHMVRLNVSGKVNLFVTCEFYHPEIEPLVVDELYQWINYLVYLFRQNYEQELSCEFSAGSGFDASLKQSEFFASPLYSFSRILEVLKKIGSPAGRDMLRALEQVFRPTVNELLTIEQKRLAAGDKRAIKVPDEGEMDCGLMLTVYDLPTILGRVLEVADSGAGS